MVLTKKQQEDMLKDEKLSEQYRKKELEKDAWNLIDEGEKHVGKESYLSLFEIHQAFQMFNELNWDREAHRLRERMKAIEGASCSTPFGGIGSSLLSKVAPSIIG